MYVQLHSVEWLTRRLRTITRGGKPIIAMGNPKTLPGSFLSAPNQVRKWIMMFGSNQRNRDRRESMWYSLETWKWEFPSSGYISEPRSRKSRTVQNLSGCRNATELHKPQAINAPASAEFRIGFESERKKWCASIRPFLPKKFNGGWLTH
jgi:hypothetical protein